jgi:hypothetical protein
MFHHCKELLCCLDEIKPPASSARVELVSPFYQASSVLFVFSLIFLDHAFLSIHNMKFVCRSLVIALKWKFLKSYISWK